METSEVFWQIDSIHFFKNLKCTLEVNMWHCFFYHMRSSPYYWQQLFFLIPTVFYDSVLFRFILKKIKMEFLQYENIYYKRQCRFFLYTINNRNFGNKNIYMFLSISLHKIYNVFFIVPHSINILIITCRALMLLCCVCMGFNLGTGTWSNRSTAKLPPYKITP